MNPIQEVERITWRCLIANVVLAAAKIGGGVWGKSQAVVADGVHSLSDTITDLAILIGVRYWSAPPDESHPHGHQRIETVITIVIGVLLAFVSLGLIYDALTSIHDQGNEKPGWIAFAAAMISIIIKEAMYRYTLRVGKRINSTALIANAWHHRSDMFSSIPAALVVLGAKFLEGWSFLDRVGALIVSVFILKAAIDISWPALKQLVDTGASPEEIAEIKRTVAAVEGVKRVTEVRTRYLGSGLEVDLNVEVLGELTVSQGHDIASAVKKELVTHGPSVLDVVVHVEPFESV